MHQPASDMQQTAAKQQSLAAMQQPDTTQQSSAAIQQPASMQPLSLDESPILQLNYSAESPNLEDTANNDNCHIEFNKYSSMPSIIDPATSGLRKSPCIAEKNQTKIILFYRATQL